MNNISGPSLSKNPMINLKKSCNSKTRSKTQNHHCGANVSNVTEGFCVLNKFRIGLHEFPVHGNLSGTHCE